MEDQKKFLITGASSSLGKIISKQIISKYGENCRMILISRSHNIELEELVSPSVLYFSEIDLLEFETNEIIKSKIDSFFNSEFALIHCAGNLWDHVPFLEVTTESAVKMMNSHYVTLYSVLRSVLPLMIKKGGGKILTFSCNAVNYNFPNMLPFNSAKAAVEATIKCIAHEYSSMNITANSLALSSLQTKAVKESKPNGDFDHYLPLGEVSETVLEILSLSNNLLNGNVINCYKYSDSYYNKGYFERIRK